MGRSERRLTPEEREGIRRTRIAWETSTEPARDVHLHRGRSQVRLHADDGYYYATEISRTMHRTDRSEADRERASQRRAGVRARLGLDPLDE